MPTPRTPRIPPIVVIFGDEEFQKTTALHRLLDSLVPPEVDRTMALCEYDGTRPEDQGGPALAAVLDDLATLPLLADRRVIVIRDADKFISAHREPLERYLMSPAPTATLILVCRAFHKATRLYKSAVAVGGQVVECKKLTDRRLLDFVVAETRARGKHMDYPVAARLLELVGREQGILAAEVEKLCLYVGGRATIADNDVSDLVGLTREERIFAVMDAAATGRLALALQLWDQVVATDAAAAFKALGGMCFVVRRWIAAHQMLADGLPIHAVAPKMMMWGRERELDTLLRRLTPARLKQILAAIAELDSQAKVGARSIETGVEALLHEVAAPAT
jgi:DNA polymerase-3 subunit delta